MIKFPVYWILVILYISVINIKCESESVSEGEPNSKYSQDNYGNKVEAEDVSNVLPVLSQVYLKKFAKAEQEVYQFVKEYTVNLESRLKEAEAYVQDYEDSTLKGTVDILDDKEKDHTVASHPFMAYRMLRRFSKEFNNLVRIMSSKMETQLITTLIKLQEKLVVWPTEHDHNEAMTSLLRLQYVYNINPREFTAGGFAGSQSSVSLTTNQGLQLIKQAVNKEYYTLAMDWLNFMDSEVARKNLRTQDEINISQIFEKIAEEHDKNFEENQNRTHLYIYDSKITGVKNYRKMRDLKLEELPQGKDRYRTVDEFGHYRFVGLCNGNNYQSEKVKSKLVCWLDTRNPYYAINPLKMELLSKEPILLQIYDIIGTKTITEVITLAKPTLQAREPREEYKVQPRSDVYAVIPDEKIPSSLYRQLPIITDLNIEPSYEGMRIASYSLGGHISNHYDTLTEVEIMNISLPQHPLVEKLGERTATFILYLNTVKKGGQTAFPFIGTAVPPTKGSSILFYNIHRNGDHDSRMMHGGCPIVDGSKWIATKWIYQKENIFKRPCALDRNL